MRFLFTIGRVTIIDFTLFRIDDPIDDPDVVVVHHHNTDDDGDESDGPDLFGKGR